jgi:DNA-binding transcriptional MerR regulator
MSIKRYEKRGWIKPIRINTRGDRRYTREEVLRFLAERGYESQNL